MSILSLSQENKKDSKGKKQGLWKKYYTGTTILDYEGSFSDDIPNGEFIYYFKNGKIKAKMVFKDLGTVSYSTIYHEDDNNLPMASGKYVNKLKDSVWNYWGPNGRISLTETFKLGVLDGRKVIYYVPEILTDKSIKIAQDLNYKNGLKHGEQKEFFDNGVLKCKSNYNNDKLVGEVISYRPSGTIELKDNYVNGVKEGWCYAYDANGLEIGKVYYRSGVRLDEKQTKLYFEKNRK
jgi:antitoxin component YwqK of YwqJK toxin-antitoxin module